ncbi:hypothetical protein HMPREF1548_04377 [Clostridium sp. KLE 1755]|nr:hypothetical protein HMPREF1548_04377 [Clostridium sp. KLE 1755]
MSPSYHRRQRMALRRRDNNRPGKICSNSIISARPNAHIA